MRLASDLTDSRSGLRSRSGTRPPAETTSVRSEFASRRARQPFPLATTVAIVDAWVAQTPASERGTPGSEELDRVEPPQPAATITRRANAETVLNILPCYPPSAPP
jgi:hypothetical protein